MIAIDGTSALAQGAGIGRLVRGMLVGLGQVDQETSYTIAYAKDAGAAERPLLPSNFRWQAFPFTEKQSVWVWQRLRLPLPADVLLGGAALYHSPDFTLPPLLRARSIVTVHDLSFEALSDVHHPKLRAYLQRVVPRAIRQATHVFADSESTRREIVAWYGTNPAKLSVVYPGVDGRFRPHDPAIPEDRAALAELRRTFGLDRPFLLSVGTLEPRKNFATVLRAFARYHKQGDGGTMLAIAGGGGWLEERERLTALVTELGLEGHARFLGFVPDAQLPPLIAGAEAMVYPSLYEGFGFPVLEALASGVPALTARNTSLPEAGGDAARYIPDASDHVALADLIAATLHDHAERERMVRAGLTHAAQFSWEATGRRVRELYKRVLEDSSF